MFSIQTGRKTTITSINHITNTNIPSFKHCSSVYYGNVIHICNYTCKIWLIQKPFEKWRKKDIICRYSLRSNLLPEARDKSGLYINIFFNLSIQTGRKTTITSINHITNTNIPSFKHCSSVYYGNVVYFAPKRI
jgi:hypothetical protein